MKIFYWDKETGWKIYNKLIAATNNEDLDDNLRFAAEALLADGKPSSMGYALRMNEFYMERFIYIITNN